MDISLNSKDLSCWEELGHNGCIKKTIRIKLTKPTTLSSNKIKYASFVQDLSDTPVTIEIRRQEIPGPAKLAVHCKISFDDEYVIDSNDDEKDISLYLELHLSEDQFDELWTLGDDHEIDIWVELPKPNDDGRQVKKLKESQVCDKYTIQISREYYSPPHVDYKHLLDKYSEMFLEECKWAPQWQTILRECINSTVEYSKEREQDEETIEDNIRAAYEIVNSVEISARLFTEMNEEINGEDKWWPMSDNGEWYHWPNHELRRPRYFKYLFNLEEEFAKYIDSPWMHNRALARIMLDMQLFSDTICETYGSDQRKERLQEEIHKVFVNDGTNGIVTNIFIYLILPYVIPVTALTFLYYYNYTFISSILALAYLLALTAHRISENSQSNSIQRIKFVSFNQLDIELEQAYEILNRSEYISIKHLRDRLLILESKGVEYNPGIFLLLDGLIKSNRIML